MRLIKAGINFIEPRNGVVGLEQGMTDIDNMVKMMEMAKLMQSFQESFVDNTPKEGVSKENDYGGIEQESDVTEYEADTGSSALMAIKAAIPHLDYKYRKNIGIMVKLIEIQNLMTEYGTSAVDMQAGGHGDWRRGMLTAIRPFMTEQKKCSLDILIKCIDISEIIQKSKKI